MSAEHPTPWHIEGQTIRDRDGHVVVSAVNPCNVSTRQQIVDAVNLFSLAGGAMEKPQTESPKGSTTWKGKFVPRAGEVENAPKPQAVPCRLPPDAPGTCPPSGGMASGENRGDDLGRRSATELRTPRKRCGFETDGCGLARGHGESSTLTPPESGCERDYGTHRVTGGELLTRVDKMPPRMAALTAPFPEPDRQPDVGRPQAVTLAEFRVNGRN